MIVFKDGIVQDQLVGLDDLGGKQDFRTEVFEHWLSKTGCLKIKKADEIKALADSDDSGSDHDSDDF